MASPSEPSNARLVLSGFVAWAITLAVAWTTWISIVALRGPDTANEPLADVALLFPLIMALPFAFVIACVTMPVVVAIRAMIGDRRLWLALAGAASAPIAVIVMIAAGRILFATHMRPTLWADLIAVASNPQGLAPVLLALAVGGIALGLGIGRRESAAAI